MPTILVAIAACGRLDFDPLADARGGAGDAGGLADASFSGSSDTYIKSSNSEAGDAFGGALALSGDGLTLAVGAAAEDSAATGIDGNQADNSAMSSGAVYVFTRAGTTWTQQAYVKASNTDKLAEFGTSIALSADGSTLAVGAIQESSDATGVNGNQADTSDLSSGAVYVFTRAATTWSQQAYIKASNTDAGDYFGASISLSGDGNTLAVSAPDERSAATGINGNQADNSAPNAGAVYVFTRVGATWSQQAYVKPSYTVAQLAFGAVIRLSRDGATLAVGMPGDSSGSVGIGGNPADTSKPFSGAVCVFTNNGLGWSQQAYVKASNPDTGDELGEAVALSSDGDTLAIDAPEESSDATGIDGNQSDNSAKESGAVYVFSRAGQTWTQQAYVKASNSRGGDQFGEALALSDDGNTLAGGATGDSSDATGIDGNQSDTSDPSAGAAYVLTRAGVTWAQSSYVKASNTSASLEFGFALALSADGSELAVSAPAESSDTTGIGGDQTNMSASNSGAVYVDQ
jgi:hypothetical protein